MDTHTNEQKDTCAKRECKFWRKYKKMCPNYITSTFGKPSGEIITLEDCAPRRNVLITMEVYNRLIALQAVSEQERNLQHGALEVMSKVASAYNPSIPLMKIEDFGEIADAEIKQIEDNNEEIAD
jgi:hypothetical protein